MFRRFSAIVAALLLIALAACTWPAPSVAPTPTPLQTERTEGTPLVGDLATVGGPTRTADVEIITVTPAPSATLEPSATVELAQPAALPAPSLFPIAWDDRDMFGSGLSDAADLENLPAAMTFYLMDVRVSEDYQAISGSQEILYTNQEEVALEMIPFRLYPNLLSGSSVVTSVQVNGQPAQGVLALQDSVLEVPLPAPLAPGESVVLALEWEVEVPTTPQGNYGSFAYLSDVLAVAHFYPFIPVYDDEGWNVEIPAEGGDLIYGDSSFYLVRLTLPAAAVAATSGVVLQEASEGAMQTLTIAAGPVRDWYLAASPKYEVVSTEVAGTTVLSYAFPAQMEVAATVLDQAAASVEIFTELYGPYPFTELEIAATPNLALGIEYPGIVVINQRLYTPDAEDGLPAEYLEPTVAHEVGHQWFYSTVGNDQLDDPWLDESLTQYVTLRYFEERYGEAAAQGFYRSLANRWQRVGGEDIPIGQPVAAFSPQEYGAIVYGRGALFFDVLAEELGEEVMQQALRDYYLSNRFEIGTPEELRETIEENCACSLAEYWAEWVE